MTDTKNTSIVRGSLADLIGFLSQDGDAADQIAQRALAVILATDAPQTGEESDTDPFVANMFASSALLLISDEIKHYPFVRSPRQLDLNESGSMAGYSGEDQVLTAALEMVESAERMMPEAEPVQPELDFYFLGEGSATDVVAALEAAQRIIEEMDASHRDRYLFIILEDAPAAN